MTVDELIPLSDHLDFFELIALCKKLRPGKVWITHTPNPGVVQHYLQEEGIATEFLEEPGKATRKTPATAANPRGMMHERPQLP
ncbi:MAG: hypothetical protein U5K31_05405 [Balneolaceae bacterium]|nr:hypothetical protein [Balneolaceae bacterium]